MINCQLINFAISPSEGTPLFRGEIMWKALTKRLFSTNSENILVSFHDKVAVIKLNRPSSLNALNSELMKELGQALVEVENNNSLSCAVITGDTKSFAGYSQSCYLFLIYFRSWCRY